MLSFNRQNFGMLALRQRLPTTQLVSGPIIFYGSLAQRLIVAEQDLAYTMFRELQVIWTSMSLTEVRQNCVYSGITINT